MSFSIKNLEIEIENENDNSDRLLGDLSHD
jgi:hypothetical protein